MLNHKVKPSNIKKFIFSFLINRNIYSRILSIVLPALSIAPSILGDSIIYRYLVEPIYFTFSIHSIRISIIEPIYGLVFTPIGFVIVFTTPIIIFYFIGVILGNVYVKTKNNKLAIRTLYFVLATFLLVRTSQYKTESFPSSPEHCPKSGNYNSNGLGRDGCLEEIALSQNNIKICDLIDDDHSEKSQCIFSVENSRRNERLRKYD